MLNDPALRPYVFDRYNYFLTRFPILVPIMFFLFSGWFHWLKSWIRNRFFWLIGYLLVRKPFESAIHIFDYKASMNAKLQKLCYKVSLVLPVLRLIYGKFLLLLIICS